MRLTKEDIQGFLEDRRSKDYRDLCSYLLHPLREWLGDRDLTPEAVKRYARKRYEEDSSYNTFLAVMKSFAKWKRSKIPPIDREHMMQRFELEQIEGIRRARVVMRLERKEFSMDELRTIFGSLEGVGFSGIWSLAWYGCRPGELVELTLDGINKKPDEYLPPALAGELGPDDYCLKFLTEKTVVERAVFMDGFTKGHLENFIKSGFGYGFLYNACVDLRRKVDANFSPKWFRSTFQTKMQRALMESGVPMVKLDLLVKVMSGHTVGGDITGIYTDFGADIKKAMTELHFLKPLEESFGGMI